MTYILIYFSISRLLIIYSYSVLDSIKYMKFEYKAYVLGTMISLHFIFYPSVLDIILKDLEMK